MGIWNLPKTKRNGSIASGCGRCGKRIFKMCLEGKGNETIARILQEQKVLVPMAYWRNKGLPRGGKKTQPNPCKWCKTTVQKILSQPGILRWCYHFKTCSKSFKNKTRLPNDPENWAIFKDVHEPIIDRNDFEKVQTLISKTKRRAPKPKNGEKSIFCDLLFCGTATVSSVTIRTQSIRIFIILYVQTIRWITEENVPADTMSEQMPLSRW